MLDERVVQRNDAPLAVLRRRISLHDFEPALVQRVLVPIGLGEETVQARLVGGLDEFVVHAGNGFVPGDHQSGQILGQMLSLRLAGKQIGEFVHGVTNYIGNLDNCGHRSDPP